MALSTGSSLGPYRIDAPLGAGDWGESYAATDSRVGRKVAVQVLPEHFAGNSEVRQRVERDANILSGLNNPHIRTLYDVGHEPAVDPERGQGVDFLVFEHLEGQTLATRLEIERGPLPLEEALQIAIDVADALAAAHREDIIHRGLTPSRIMLTTEGVARQSSPQAKILDFGLAAVRSSAAATASDVSDVADVADVAMTQTEVAPLISTGGTADLDTLRYSAPEQIDGREASAATDLFSLGAILHEMLTGSRAFEGDSQAAVVGAVLERDPPSVSTLAAGVPPALDRLIKKCLTKDPDARWQSARDLRDELTWVAERATQGDHVAIAPQPAAWRRVLPWAAAGLGLILAAGVGVWMSRPTAIPTHDTLELMLPANVELVRWALSPDGHHLAYSGESADGATHLYHRQLDQRDAVRMPGTEGADVLTFSPNGEWIAFTTGNELKRISLAGGSAVPVSTLPEGPYGVSCTAWTEDDTIWCGSIGLPLHRVAASGGVLQPIEGALGWLPRPLPGGRGVLYSGGRTPSDSEDIYGVDRGFWAYIPQSGEHHQIMAEFWVTGPASNLTFVSTGHLLYVSPWEPNASSPSPGGSSLWAAPFDLERLEIVGEPVRVRDGVDFFVVGREGSLVYRPPPPLPQQALVWVGRGGREEPLAIRPRRGYRTPRLSSDGTRVAIGVLDRQSTWADQIWVHDLDRGADLMIAGDGTLTPQQYPFWTTDGGLLFTRGTSFDTVREMTMLVAADGSNQPEMLFVDLEGFVPVDWTADGNLLMVENAKGYLDSDIGIMTTDGRDQWEPLIATERFERNPVLSPNGRWLAYESAETATGQYEIYVTPFPDASTGVVVSNGGGNQPTWSPDGTELFYRQGVCEAGMDRECESQMVSVAINAGPPFTPGAPEVLFADPYYMGHARNYDVASNGRFLMVKTLEQPEPRLVVERDWLDELKEKVPIP